MNIYHIWCDLKPGVSDMGFAEKANAWLGHLKQEGLIEGWQLTRRKLGLAPAGLGEFHVAISVTDMAQLDRAFERAAARAEPAEGFHHAMNALVANASFALYRDFPDGVRRRGEEKF